jgi:hypothetical protein
MVKTVEWKLVKVLFSIKISIKILCLLVFCFCTVSQAYGIASPPKKIYTIKGVIPEPPAIDGKLDDSTWRETQWESEFVQLVPYEGKNPSQKTAFKVIYDNQYIYIAIRAYDTEANKIVRRMARRDNYDGDWVAVNIDSYHDLRTAFSFAVNAEGVKCDLVITEDGLNEDSSWDPIWFAKTSVDDKGWVAEMKIPFSQLRFGQQDTQVWGFQCTRYLYRNQERSQWQFIPRDAPGQVHMYGELRGIRNIRHSRQMELTPYLVGKMQRFQREEGNPFATGKRQNALAGLDGKIGLSSNLTLDFTINPDFGQVEADPSEVNLTTTETYFSEKRPFFIEGRNIMDFQITSGDGDFSQDNLFYSRRIGRPPQHDPDTGDDEHLNQPANTTILGAFKITGKTKNGLSIGIMDSITSREEAEIDINGNRRNEGVEPMTNYFLMSLRKDFNAGKTILSSMFTATNRFLSDRDPQLHFLHKSAYTGGVNFLHQWKKNTYCFRLSTIFSFVQGDKEAILNTQESPLRYYQRPDASHLSVDPNRTSLSGHGGTISLEKAGNSHFLYETGVTWRSPGLELNDAGYLRSADRIMQWVWMGYRIWKPFAIFKNIEVNLNQWTGWDFSGEKVFGGGNISIWMKFKNNWSISTGINPQNKSLSTTSMRGGPALRLPGGNGYWFYINSASSKPLRFSIGTERSHRGNNAFLYRSYSSSVDYNPGSRLSISISPDFSHNSKVLQYVDTLDFQGEKRYIFGSLDQKTISMTIRLNYCITPELSIQFYGQPFISAGKYSEFKHITSPRAAKIEDRYYAYSPREISYDSAEETYNTDIDQDGVVDYSFSNPNYNFIQFRSNLVLRWEYHPGSTVYLVWSQGRTESDSNGDFHLGNGFRDLFSVEPHNVFLVKFTYRFKI